MPLNHTSTSPLDHLIPKKEESEFLSTLHRSTKRLGILGSGQLGQMMAMAAKKMGFQVIVFDAVAEGPAVSYADHFIQASFDDQNTLEDFASRVDLITLEFENIPPTTLNKLAGLRPLYPAPAVVHICQDRVLEKEFLKDHGFPVAPFVVVTSAKELAEGISELGNSPCILKTATLGYDGKGQVALHPGDNLDDAWKSLKALRAVLEKKISFCAEASVITARSTTGEVRSFPIQENIHRHGILDFSIAPARFEKKVLLEAERIANTIAETLDVVGLITVEFFVLPNGELIVNELAPRPHNSGHHTIESSKTSQFEQMIRAITNLPLGSTELEQNAVMVNLLGDLWNNGEPDWKPLLENPAVTLHLYGKKIAKPGRKMGHFTVTGKNQEEVIALAKQLNRSLTATRQENDEV